MIFYVCVQTHLKKNNDHLLDLEGNDEGDDHKQRDNDHKEKNEEVKGANLTSPTNQSCKFNDNDSFKNSMKI